MYNYSIMPLNNIHFEEIVADIKEQFNRGVTTCPLFIMVLVPEGNETCVWDKVEPLCKMYERFRQALEIDGIPSGVLIQASLGHGYDINVAPFTQFIGLRDGKKDNVYCPLDDDFLNHFKNVVKRIAQAKPSAIMLDDDFRLLMRPGGGCACELHMKEFAKRTGKEWSREELFEHVKTHPADDPLTVAFLDMQKDSLVNMAKVLRQAIDEVDPTIQGINCTSGDICESVTFTNPEFCGKGNPTIVRVPCGSYAPTTVREFSTYMRRAAVCYAKLKKAGIDIILAETDTIPFNRYGKNARYLHSHFTSTILEGLTGAKHWITRTTAWEPKSGKAYRDILAKHNGFYNALTKYVDGIEWVGANSAFIVQERYDYSIKNLWFYHDNYWATKCFERLGLPFYFAEPSKSAKLTFFEDCIVTHMTDDQIRAAFDGTVCMTGEVASDLIKRGFGDLIGVDVKKWEGVPATSEFFNFDTSAICTKQKDCRMITILNDKVETLSWSSRYIDNKYKKLSPAVTVLDRGNGKLSVVFAGTPNANHDYMEGFSFLNESRKRQFIDIFSRAGALPIYYDGDEEVILRAGKIKDGRLFATFINIGYDPLDELDIVLNFTPTNIKYLDPSGNEVDLNYTKTEDGKIKVMTKLEPLYPLVLFIK
jgi:hypothetical protein